MFLMFFISKLMFLTSMVSTTVYRVKFGSSISQTVCTPITD